MLKIITVDLVWKILCVTIFMDRAIHEIKHSINPRKSFTSTSTSLHFHMVMEGEFSVCIRLPRLLRKART